MIFLKLAIGVAGCAVNAGAALEMYKSGGAQDAMLPALMGVFFFIYAAKQILNGEEG